MNFTFGNTSYVQALNKKDFFESDSDILRYASRNLQFNYGDVNSQEFNVKYSSEGWLGRKVIAIPAAFWSGVVKTAYHVAKAVFIGFPKEIFGNRCYLSAQLFNVARDLQESFGRLTTLFNDRYGQFHVQESQFHKACYKRHTIDSKKGCSHTENDFHERCLLPEGGLLMDESAATMSLFDYQSKTVEERKELIKKFNLYQVYSKLPGSDMSLNKFINQADDEMLKFITLTDLIALPEYSSLKYALMDDESFGKLLGPDISRPSHERGQLSRPPYVIGQLLVIKQRLQKHLKGDLSDEQLDDFRLTHSYFNYPVVGIPKMSAEQVARDHEKIIEYIFSLLRNDQVKDLTLSELSKDNQRALFAGLNAEEAQERLVLFDLSALVLAAQSEKLDSEVIKLFSADHLKALKLSEMSVPAITELFPPFEYEIEFDKARFVNFEVAEVQAALKNNKIGPYQMRLISDDQFTGTELSTLTLGQIQFMFNKFGDQEVNERRFATFEAADVQAALKDGKLDPYPMSLISDGQLKGLKLSTLSEKTIWNLFSPINELGANKKRFAEFEVADVHAVLEIGNLRDYCLKVLASEKQLLGLNAITSK